MCIYIYIYIPLCIYICILNYMCTHALTIYDTHTYILYTQVDIHAYMHTITKPSSYLIIKCHCGHSNIIEASLVHRTNQQAC